MSTTIGHLMPCETCGAICRIASNAEGTQYYIPLSDNELREVVRRIIAGETICRSDLERVSNDGEHDAEQL